MTYDEIMAGFDELFEEVRAFLNDEEPVEGDPPLHDLGTRLNALCAAVLELPADEMPPAIDRMKELRDLLQNLSSFMQEVTDAVDKEKENEADIEAEDALELASTSAKAN